LNLGDATGSICIPLTTIRDTTLDITKGIGIALIVLGHSWVTMRERGELYRVIFSFHVPLFFYLSGVFLRPSESLGTYISSRFHALLKPYFVTLTAVGVFKLTYCHFFPDAHQLSAIDYFSGIFYGTGRMLFLSEQSVVWVALWFLPHLFLSSVITLAITRRIKRPAIIFAYAILALTLGVKSLSPHDLAWSIDLIPISSAMLCFGYLSSDKLNPFQFKVLPFLLALSAFSALHYLFNETIDINMREYGNFFICTAQVFLGVYLCLGVASILAKFRGPSQLASYIGSGSLFILLFHWLFQAYTFAWILKVTNHTTLAWSAGFIAGIIFPLALLEVVKRNALLTLLLLPRKAVGVGALS
jgi:fucose 4-O-acetylase-like acetyltransferase